MIVLLSAPLVGVARPWAAAAAVVQSDPVPVDEGMAKLVAAATRTAPQDPVAAGRAEAKAAKDLAAETMRRETQTLRYRLLSRQNKQRQSALGTSSETISTAAFSGDLDEAKRVGEDGNAKVVDRDQANRYVLASYTAGYLTTIDTANSEIERIQESIIGRDCTYGRCEAEAQEIAEWQARKDTAQKFMDGLGPLQDRILDNAKPYMYLLLIKPETGGSGQLCVAVGNPDTASQVVVYVPGMETNVRKPMTDVERAEKLYRDGRAFGQNVSSIFWLGYDSPTPLTVATADNAMAARDALANFLADRRLTHVGSQAHTTVLAHSYGTLVTGLTARDRVLATDEVILIGSPGVSADIDEFRIMNASGHYANPREHVWASAMKGDPIPCLGLTWPTNCMMQIVIPQTLRFGPNPIHPDFGAKWFTSGSDSPDTAHSAYWDDGKPSRISIANIAFGPGGSNAPRLMVVGDSISHGAEGDYTWRYRLKEHFEQTTTPVDFVGPYKGTIRLREAGETGSIHDGGYGPGNLDFDSEHFAIWGWNAAFAKDQVQSAVSDYRPDYLLVELGFNDLTWLGETPEQLRENMRILIENARAGNPNMCVMVANVVHRTPLSVLPDLDSKVDQYNSVLADLVATMNTSSSPVRLIDLSSVYDAANDTYDGLHPDPVGEYKIAKAFADGFASLGLGPEFGPIPGGTSEFTPATPASIQAIPTDAGMTVKWAHSYGARGYRLYARNATMNFLVGVFSVGADSWSSNWVWKDHTYEYMVVAVRDADHESPPSVWASAVASPKTSLGPTGIQIWPHDGYIDLAWTAPTGEFSESVYGYKIMWVDDSVPGSWLQTQEVIGATSGRVASLVNGHRYTFWLASINSAGEGWPSGAGAGVAGYEIPAETTLTGVRLTDWHEVELTWNPVPGASGYDVLVYPPGSTDAGHYGQGQTAVARVGWLFEGAAKYTYCVVAINGSYKSRQSNCAQPKLDKPVLQARLTSPWDVCLDWTAVTGATGYRVLVRDATVGETFGVHGETGSNANYCVGWLFGGAGAFEWCVLALNGAVASDPSNCMRGQLNTPNLWDARIVEQRGVRLEWDAVPATMSYQVYGRDRIADPNGPWLFKGSTGDTYLGVGQLSTDAERWEWYVTAANNGSVSQPSNVLRSNPA